MALPPLRIEIGADPTQAVAGLERVQTEAMQTGKAVDAMGQQMVVANKRMATVGGSSRRFGSQVQNASYQVQDFTVQIASGTGAVRAMSQQLPQLLGGFGVFGALAGAAVGVVAALVFQLDETDSALRQFAVRMGFLTARSLTEAQNEVQGLTRDVESLEQTVRKLMDSLNDPAQAKNFGYLMTAIAGATEKLEEKRRRLAAAQERLNKFQQAEEATSEGRRKGRAPGGRVAGSVPEDDGLGGEGAGGEAPEDAAYVKRLQNRLEQVRQFTATEQELMAQRYQTRHETLVEALAQELITEKEFLDQSTALREKQAQDLAAIQEANSRKTTDATANMFGAMSRLAESGGKRMAGLAKGFAIAEAIVNTYAGATRAFKDHPFPLSAAIASTVIAAGLANIASIMAVNTSGSGSATPSGGGAATAAAAPQPLEVTLSGFGPNDLFTGSQLSGLFDKLQDEAGDRGVTFARVAA